MLVDEVCYQCELVEITARKSGCHPIVIYSAIGAYSIGSLKLDLCSNTATTVLTHQIQFWEQHFFI